MPFTCSSAVGHPLLRVAGLRIAYTDAEGTATSAICDISFTIDSGEIVGILGESGCGKSTLALSLLKLLPINATCDGSILFRGQNLIANDERQMQAVRGAEISLIHQDAGLSLNPVMRVGDQIAEVIGAHKELTRQECKQEVYAILRAIHLTDVERTYDAYPHQLSGGQLHRIVIAQALVCSPSLVIADEPTRALDVTLQSEILNLLKRINRERRTSFIFITHNPALLAEFSDRVLVMYAGQIIEQGRTAQVFREPLHPYTKALLRLVPRMSPGKSGPIRHLPAIPGNLPDMRSEARGCRFAQRCVERMDVCGRQDPEEIIPEAERRVSCFIYGN